MTETTEKQHREFSEAEAAVCGICWDWWLGDCRKCDFNSYYNKSTEELEDNNIEHN